MSLSEDELLPVGVNDILGSNLDRSRTGLYIAQETKASRHIKTEYDPELYDVQCKHHNAAEPSPRLDAAACFR